MTMLRRSLLLVIACAAVAVIAAPALAAERDYWRHSDGHFENTAGNKWVEKIGGNTHRFVETERTDTYVELYDSGRDITVRLFNNRCMVKVGKKPFEKYYSGGWR
jgi:hypothetical protein